VLLLEPEPTSFDLRWRMFGIPVRVHPFFWVMSAMLGWTVYLDDGLSYLFLWIFAVFVSILIHELGHIFMGRAFGSDGHIVLYSFGGLAIGSNQVPHWWQRVAVSFAGPAAGFVLAAVIYFVMPNLTNMPVARWFVSQMFGINLLWGLMNLLPVWPLDGGQISREVCGVMFREKGLFISLVLSIVVAGGLAVVKAGFLPRSPSLNQFVESWPEWLALSWRFIVRKDMYLAILFALLAAGCVQAYHAETQRRRWHEDDFPWAR
jgi:Zn-dependent protease